MIDTYFFDLDDPVTGRVPVQVRQRGRASGAAQAALRGAAQKFLVDTRLGRLDVLRRTVRLPGGRATLTFVHGQASIEAAFDTSEQTTRSVPTGIVLRLLNRAFGETGTEAPRYRAPVFPAGVSRRADGKAFFPERAGTAGDSWSYQPTNLLPGEAVEGPEDSIWSKQAECVLMVVEPDADLTDRPVENGAVRFIPMAAPKMCAVVEVPTQQANKLLVHADADGCYIGGIQIAGAPGLPDYEPENNAPHRLCAVGFDPLSLEDCADAAGTLFFAHGGALFGWTTGDAGWTQLDIVDAPELQQEFGALVELLPDDAGTTLRCSGSDQAGVRSSFTARVTAQGMTGSITPMATPITNDLPRPSPNYLRTLSHTPVLLTGTTSQKFWIGPDRGATKEDAVVFGLVNFTSVDNVATSSGSPATIGMKDALGDGYTSYRSARVASSSRTYEGRRDGSLSTGIAPYTWTYPDGFTLTLHDATGTVSATESYSFDSVYAHQEAATPAVPVTPAITLTTHADMTAPFDGGGVSGWAPNSVTADFPLTRRNKLAYWVRTHADWHTVSAETRAKVEAELNAALTLQQEAFDTYDTKRYRSTVTPARTTTAWYAGPTPEETPLNAVLQDSQAAYPGWSYNSLPAAWKVGGGTGGSGLVTGSFAPIPGVPHLIDWLSGLTKNYDPRFGPTTNAMFRDAEVEELFAPGDSLVVQGRAFFRMRYSGGNVPGPSAPWAWPAYSYTLTLGGAPSITVGTVDQFNATFAGGGVDRRVFSITDPAARLVASTGLGPGTGDLWDLGGGGLAMSWGISPPAAGALEEPMLPEDPQLISLGDAVIRDLRTGTEVYQMWWGNRVGAVPQYRKCVVRNATSSTSMRALVQEWRDLQTAGGAVGSFSALQDILIDPPFGVALL